MHTYTQETKYLIVQETEVTNLFLKLPEHKEIKARWGRKKGRQTDSQKEKNKGRKERWERRKEKEREYNRGEMRETERDRLFGQIRKWGEALWLKSPSSPWQLSLAWTQEAQEFQTQERIKWKRNVGKIQASLGKKQFSFVLSSKRMLLSHFIKNKKSH